MFNIDSSGFLETLETAGNIPVDYSMFIKILLSKSENTSSTKYDFNMFVQYILQLRGIVSSIGCSLLGCRSYIYIYIYIYIFSKYSINCIIRLIHSYCLLLFKIMYIFFLFIMSYRTMSL